MLRNLRMDFLEDYFDVGGFDFIDALDYLEALDEYDSSYYWYSGSEDSGSHSFSSGDGEKGLPDCNFEVYGQYFSFRRNRELYSNNDTFPVSLEGIDELSSESEPFSPLPSLMDLSAQIVAQRIPYSYIQRVYALIPEKVAKKILLWSFPRNETDIYRYWVHHEEEIPQQCHVERIDQFGFCVQGKVTFLSKTHTVSLLCDRCVITSASCSCRNRNQALLWCRHIVALAICRIQHANVIEVYLPIFDSVSTLNRDQLQKLLQYLTCDDQPFALRSLQSEVSRVTLKHLLVEDVEDVTAPSVSERRPNWYLEPIERDGSGISSVYVRLLLRKAAEMFKAGDITNGMCVFRFLLHHIPCHPLLIGDDWDNTYIGLISIVSSPLLSYEQKEECCSIIKQREPFYPNYPPDVTDLANPVWSLWRNNINHIASRGAKLTTTAEKARKSLFYMPLASIDLCWDDRNLRKILNSDVPLLDIDPQEFAWIEHFPTSCTRIEVLFNNGYKVEALRLAVYIAKSAILQVKQWKQSWVDALHDGTISQTRQKVQRLMNSAGESWLNQTMIIHKLDPVYTLFSCLKNASLVLKSISKDNPVIEEHQYLQLGIEALIVILSQQLLPKNKSKSSLLTEFHQHEYYWLKCILSIVSTNIDDTLTEVPKPKIDATKINNLLKLLADAGPFTVLGSAGDYFIPRYQWGYMMVKILYHIDKKLAEEAGRKCLKYPLSKLASVDYDGKHETDHMKLVICVLSLHDGNSKETEEILNKADYLNDPCASMLFLQVFKHFSISASDGFPEVTVFTRKMIYKRLFKALQTGKSNSDNCGMRPTSLLEFAAVAGHDAVIETLENWTNLFSVSSSIEILQHCDWAENIYGSHPKNQACLANAVYNLIERCVTAGMMENYSMFQALLEIKKKINFTEKQTKALNEKIFSLGIRLPTPPDTVYTTLSRLIDDKVKCAAFRNFVYEAIEKHNITSERLFSYSQREEGVSLSSAFYLGLVAVENLLILPNCHYGSMQVNFEINCIVNIFKLAMDLGENEVREIMSSVISNIKHDAVLCDVTRKLHTVVMNKNRVKPEWLESFVNNVMGILWQSLMKRAKRLRNESPFINRLKRTKGIYLLANDGQSQFLSLISHLKPLLPHSKRKCILRSVGIFI